MKGELKEREQERNTRKIKEEKGWEGKRRNVYEGGIKRKGIRKKHEDDKWGEGVARKTRKRYICAYEWKNKGKRKDSLSQGKRSYG